MTADEVRKIEAYGRRIAVCVLKTGDLVTEVAQSIVASDPEAAGRFLLKVMEINNEMTAATDCFVAESYPSEEWDS